MNPTLQCAVGLKWIGRVSVCVRESKVFPFYQYVDCMKCEYVYHFAALNDSVSDGWDLDPNWYLERQNICDDELLTYNLGCADEEGWIWKVASCLSIGAGKTGKSATFVETTNTIILKIGHYIAWHNQAHTLNKGLLFVKRNKNEIMPKEKKFIAHRIITFIIFGSRGRSIAASFYFVSRRS